MECWILYDGEPESLDAGAYEARRLLEAGRRQDIDIRIIKPEQVDVVVTSDDRQSVLIDGQVVTLPDFVLTRISGDINYFTLAVIRHLERLGVPCINNSSSMEAVKDKLHSHQILAENAMPVPRTMLGRFPIDTDLVENMIGFPIVVKTLSGTHGNGVFLCENRNHFEDLMQLVGQTQGQGNLLFQEFISSSRGRDLRVLVVAGKAIAAMERRASDGSFKANFSRGGTVRSYEITPEIESIAIRTAQLLDLDITGIDLLFDGNGYQICEANCAPDFRGLESCCDISAADEMLAAAANIIRRKSSLRQQIETGDRIKPFPDTQAKSFKKKRSWF